MTRLFCLSLIVALTSYVHIHAHEKKAPPKNSTNSIGMKFVWIPPGNFVMGSPKEEKERQDNETQHKVTLTKGFYMGIHPVTRGQFATFVEKSGFKTQAEKEGGSYVLTAGKVLKLDAAINWRSPGFEQTNDDPVVCVSWN